MKKFWIRTINVCVIVAALIGYSKVTLAHEQTDAAAKAEADRKNAEIAAEAGETGGSYTDGTYQGTATGFGGDITVEVNHYRWQDRRCGYPVCRKRRQCLSDDGKRYHSRRSWMHRARMWIPSAVRLSAPPESKMQRHKLLRKGGAR